MKKFLPLVFILAFLSAVTGVGVAPGYQDLGEVRAGETAVVNLYVTASTYDSSFEVVPETDNSISSTFLDPQDSPVSAEEFSEEDIGSWVRFNEESYTVTPTNTTPYVLDDGTPINAAGAIKFYIEVPQDAEPGYHAGMIDLNPQLGDGGEGFGAQIQKQSMHEFAFRVPGEASRNLNVDDVRGIRTGDEKARVDLRISNTGTVTTSLRGGDIDVYNRNTGQKLSELSLGTREIPPGQNRVISANVRSGNLERGQYRLNGTLDYLSGESFVDGQTFALSSQVVENEPDADEFETQATSEEEGSPPVWLLALFVLVTSSVLYSFEFDLFWIMIFAGGLGITGFILISGIPNWTLLILLTSSVVTVLYV